MEAPVADLPGVDDELFSYAAGALDEPARARVEALLDADPELRARLKWYEAVCDGVVQARAPLPALPSADQIVARVRGAAADGPARGFFAWVLGPALRPVAAFAAVVIVIQAAVIGTLLGDRSDTQAVRSTGAQLKAVVFVIAFDPDAPESQIRTLLLKAGATIIDGPRQLGDYRVSVPANRAEFARQLFEESGIAEYVRLQEP
jgi:anti-sigma-K factor RskA